MASVSGGDKYGTGYIAGESPGIVTVAGAPASRRVEIYDSITRALVAFTASQANGTFRVDRLNTGRKYNVIAYDHEEIYNAVIRARITPAESA